MKHKIEYPSGAEFAFTILDDTDDTTVSNGRPVYEFMHQLGLRTTKTVWAFDTTPENQGPYFAGETLASTHYLEWVRELKQKGFEIAFHNATMGSSLRDDTIRALDFIEKEIGQRVRLHCNHGQNRENLHWGLNRYNSSFIRKPLGLYSKFMSAPEFEGDDPKSPYYWSDIADQRLSYIRAFTFRQQLNSAKVPPGRPYKDSSKQKELLFFNTTDAPDVHTFKKIINKSTINRLRDDNGWAIISTHLGKGFYRANNLDTEFRDSMEYLATQPGWFVPASQLLDFISKNTGEKEISTLERIKMEYLHVIDRIVGRFLRQ